jgi:hypothetical protein
LTQQNWEFWQSEIGKRELVENEDKEIDSHSFVKSDTGDAATSSAEYMYRL